MTQRRPKLPPRPLTPGDVVVTFHHDLGEWTAAQVTRLDSDEGLADVLDLDWSSPTRPDSVMDLGPLRPLVRNAGSWSGEHSHSHAPWVLPRSCAVVGNTAPLVSRSSDTYGLWWRIGDALNWERLAASGRSDWDDDPDQVTIDGPELRVPDHVDGMTTRRLMIRDVARVDTAVIADTFPNLRELWFYGELAEMTNAVALNRLANLRELSITGYFGMTAADVLTVGCTSDLEYIDLHNIPHEYATATRRVWRPEAARGTYLSVSGARKADWVAENKNNPLREWDGRDGISKAAYRKSVAQLRNTRLRVLAALDGPESGRPSLLGEIGKEYGRAFNAIDLGTRDGFIMTEEREELYAALAGIVTASAEKQGLDLADEERALINGLDATRDW
ncbi:hypothetical protein [Promicromonospora sp. NPDC057488]|uniref:hypothetical protein n=1 Tax=Promicromonospora sp. NPDC057488 TaxID=3346147 RepID=UPI00366C370E